MLKFIQNKTSNRKTIKPLANYKPELIYGHTQQSPNQFKNKFSIYYNSKIDDHTSNSLKGREKLYPMHGLDEIKGFVKQKNEKKIPHHYRNQSDFQVPETIKDGNSTKGEYKMGKGEFSNFLDINKHNNNIAVAHRQYLNKQTRDEFLKKSASTHQFSWNKSINTESKYDAQTSLLTSKFSNLKSDGSVQRTEVLKTQQFSLLNRSSSMSIFQRKTSQINLIRRRVQEFKENKKMQTLKALETRYSNFGLPKIGVNHEIYLLDNKKSLKLSRKSESDEVNQEIQKFEDRILKKFK